VIGLSVLHLGLWLQPSPPHGCRQEGQAIVRAGRHSGQNFKVFCAAFNRLQVRP
jgi:hypothetical protein